MSDDLSKAHDELLDSQRVSFLDLDRIEKEIKMIETKLEEQRLQDQKNKGFTLKAEYLKSESLGCPHKREYDLLQSGSFTSYKVYQAATAKGFSQMAEFEESELLGCPNKSEYGLVRSGSFASYETYQAAKWKGFSLKEEHDESERLGCLYKIEYDLVRSGSFTSYKAFQTAKEKGFSQKAEYEESERLGCPNKHWYDVFKRSAEYASGKFPSYAAYGKGFSQMAEFEESERLGCPNKRLYDAFKLSDFSVYDDVCQRAMTKGFSHKAEYEKSERLGCPDKRRYDAFMRSDEYRSGRILSYSAYYHSPFEPMALVGNGQDICDHFFRIETKSMPNRHYMHKQKTINGEMREILIDWLVELGQAFCCVPGVLWLSVNILDRFMERLQVDRSKLQLVGSVAFLIACKYEETSSLQETSQVQSSTTSPDFGTPIKKKGKERRTRGGKGRNRTVGKGKKNSPIVGNISTRTPPFTSIGVVDPPNLDVTRAYKVAVSDMVQLSDNAFTNADVIQVGVIKQTQTTLFHPSLPSTCAHHAHSHAPHVVMRRIVHV
jgi:hypothetical protein